MSSDQTLITNVVTVVVVVTVVSVVTFCCSFVGKFIALRYRLRPIYT
jgi:hypothetical protein